MWKQDRTPNLDDSTMTVNDSGAVLKTWCGYCLAVAETTFGTPRYYRSAFTAWQNTQYKHTDQNWPLNVYFPIFYEWWGTIDGVYANYGHVVTAYWDGTILRIWSAPYTNKPYFDRFTNDLNLGGHYGGIRFLGWAEDLATARICHQEADPVPTPVAKYTVTETYSPAKMVQLNKQPTYLWGMNYDFDYMVAHPVETHNQGEIWPIDNKVHHQDGSDYYRRAGQIDGFNIVDCDDYTPPVVVPPVVTPPVVPDPPAEPTPPVTDPVVSDPPTKVTTGPTSPVVVSVPPKVIVPEPTYYRIWELFLAILQKIFKKK